MKGKVNSGHVSLPGTNSLYLGDTARQNINEPRLSNPSLMKLSAPLQEVNYSDFGFITVSLSK